MRYYQYYTMLCLALVMCSGLIADTWIYDFGTNTSSLSVAGQSTTFLPTAPSGTARVRVGTSGGSINMENPGLSGFGSGTELRIVASTNLQYNKFAIYDYLPSPSFYTKFSMRMGSTSGVPVDSGTFNFMMGDGIIFANNSGFDDLQTFTVLQMILAPDGSVTLRYRRTGAWVVLTPHPITQNSTLNFEIFANNTTSSIDYNAYGADQSVAVNKFDLWINGTLYGNDLTKNRLADAANIDSFMFYADSSTNNVANLFLDDIVYQNGISSDYTLPVELSSFTAVTTAENSVKLDWTTQSETAVSGYYIYRNTSLNLDEALVVSPLIFASNTSMEQNYSFTDSEVSTGTWYYWLQSVDFDGQMEYHGPIVVSISSPSDPTLPSIPPTYVLHKIYPNPFNPDATIAFDLAKSAPVRIDILNLRGQIVRSIVSANFDGGTYRRTWDGTDDKGRPVSTGVYCVRMTVGSVSYSRKVVLLK